MEMKLIERSKTALVFLVENPKSPSRRERYRRKSEPVTTCTVDSTGLALVVDRPIEQKRVYKPDEVGFSAESIFNSWSGEINIKLILGSGSETEELMIYCVGRFS